MGNHEKIDYVEFASRDLKATKAFFEKAFGWSFKDYGDEYCDFSNQGLNGGFFQADMASVQARGGALIVFYSENLEQTQGKIEAAGGSIVRNVFEFPGGRRFHFVEPCGNEFAVWSDK